MSIIANFETLHKLKPEFVQNIKFICIIPQIKTKAVIVTKDDNVFAIIDINAELVESDDSDDSNNPDDSPNGSKVIELSEPINVIELCKKSIIDIKYGFNFTIALSKSGSCYSWGLNKNGQLGNGSTSLSDTPQEVKLNEQIKQISCGAHHTLLLTLSSKVYAFGFNAYGQIGCGYVEGDKQLSPILINALEKEEVRDISCGTYHSLALTAKHVFIWGSNTDGQIGIGHSLGNVMTPFQLVLNPMPEFKSISCGAFHTMLLTVDGEIYTFGFNKFGQIGNGSTEKQSIPIKIKASVKFTEIVSHFDTNISVAKSENGFYVWGRYNEQVIKEPMQTSIQSIHDIFSIDTKGQYTYDLILM